MNMTVLLRENLENRPKLGHFLQIFVS